MEIRKVSNGYITKNRHGSENVFKALGEVFDHLLRYFESRSDTFVGDGYGKVVVLDKPLEDEVE